MTHTKPHFVQHYFSQVSEEDYGGPLQILLLWACSLIQFTVSKKKEKKEKNNSWQTKTQRTC
jgi:hypothetical protein